MILFKVWQINIQQNLYLHVLKNFTNKVIHRLKLQKNSVYHRKLFLLGLRNLTLNREYLKKEINGAIKTLIGKGIQQVTQLNTTGLKNKKVKLSNAPIVERLRHIKVLLSGQIRTICMKGI